MGTQGQYAEAEPLYKRALVIYEQALGPGPSLSGHDPEQPGRALSGHETGERSGCTEAVGNEALAQEIHGRAVGPQPGYLIRGITGLSDTQVYGRVQIA